MSALCCQSLPQPPRRARISGDENDRLHAVALDITDGEAATAVAAENSHTVGAIDVLVNNAGHAGFDNKPPRQGAHP